MVCFPQGAALILKTIGDPLLRKDTIAARDMTYPYINKTIWNDLEKELVGACTVNPRFIFDRVRDTLKDLANHGTGGSLQIPFQLPEESKLSTPADSTQTSTQDLPRVLISFK